VKDPEFRAADADRERVVEKLRTALDEGRLDLVEYDERVKYAYAARTYAELEPLTADLPGPSPTRQAQIEASEKDKPRIVENTPDSRSRIAWRSWFTVSMICAGIWAVIAISSGGMAFFWPLWVMLPWGLVLLAQLMQGKGRRVD
jgi:hypothetical protein